MADPQPRLRQGEIDARSRGLAQPLPPYPLHLHAPLVRRPPDNGDMMITPQFVLRVLWQWWYILVPISLICAVAAAATVYVTFTPVYRASAQVQIASQTPYIAFAPLEMLGIDKKAEFVETQIELLQSELVLEPVVALPAIASIPEVRDQADAIGWLSKRIRVSQVGRSELFQVSFDGPEPEEAAVIVNAVLDSYFEVRRIDEENRTGRVEQLLEQERDEWLARKQSLQQKMKDLAGANWLSLLNKSGDRGNGPLENLQEQVTDAEVDAKVMWAEIQALEEDIARSGDEVPVGGVDIEMGVNESEVLQGLRTKLAVKLENLHETERHAAGGKNDVSYRRLSREVEDLERQIAHAESSMRPRIAQQLREMAALDRRDALAKMKVEKEHLDQKVKSLREQFNSQLTEVAKSDKSIELEILRSELLSHDSALAKIDDRLTVLRTEKKAPGRVTLLRRAEPPRGPVERMPLRSLALAAIASGGLPLGLVLLWELSVRRITHVEQLVQKSALSVVGEVAKLPLGVRLGGNRRKKGLSLFEESIDSLRVCLWLPEDRKDVQVLAVCSAIHGEGKTSIASQLAVSIARSSNDPVLLIDADLRSPDVHHIFNVSAEPGLAKVLAERCTLDDAIVTSWSDKVHLLPAGRLQHSPHKLLGGDLFPKLLRELRSRYRIIIIDTPPILSASESLLLAKLSDGTVLCTRRNYSREHQVRMAFERLIAAGARPLGAVFNAVPTRRYAYTYGSYDYSRRFDDR